MAVGAQPLLAYGRDARHVLHVGLGAAVGGGHMWLTVIVRLTRSIAVTVMVTGSIGQRTDGRALASSHAAFHSKASPVQCSRSVSRFLSLAARAACPLTPPPACG